VIAFLHPKSTNGVLIELEEMSDRPSRGREIAMAKKAGEAEVRPVVSTLGTPVKVFYGPDDLPDFDYKEKLNDPGEYFTRGVYSTMHRSSLWTMRQYSGQS